MKVLFIGNSHTYVENLPWVFAAVCRQAGIELHTTMCTYPGCDWNWHLESTCTMANLRYGMYDFIVIQQRSHPFDGEESLIKQGTLLIEEINKVQAKAVLFNTWSEKNNPVGQEKIDEAFHRLHILYPDCLLARCGAAWHSLRGVIDLYADDGEHQNSYGAYLNACVLAITIFGIEPTNLPCDIDTKALLVKTSQREIKLLHEAASKA